MSNKVVCRPAELKDIESLIDLRKILLDSGTEHYAAQNDAQQKAWQTAYRDWLQRFLTETRSVVNIFVLEETLDNEDEAPESKVIKSDSKINGDSKIVGCATGVIDHRAPMIGALSGKTGWIQSVIIQESWRGQGLTRTLLNNLYAWFRHHEVEEVFLQSTPMALEAYKHLGFVVTNEAYLIKHLNS